MKLLFLLLLLPFGASAQQDFDYAIYTRHSQHGAILIRDSALAELSIERRIIKEGIRLTIASCQNPGNATEFKIHFEGFGLNKIVPRNANTFFGGQHMESLEYVTDDQKYSISIWPTIPLVEIHETKTGKLYARYY